MEPCGTPSYYVYVAAKEVVTLIQPVLYTFSLLSEGRAQFHSCYRVIQVLAIQAANWIGPFALGCHSAPSSSCNARGRGLSNHKNTNRKQERKG